MLHTGVSGHAIDGHWTYLGLLAIARLSSFRRILAFYLSKMPCAKASMLQRTTALHMGLCFEAHLAAAATGGRCARDAAALGNFINV